MSSNAVIVIAVVAVVVLGVVAFLTLARRSDVRGAGALSAETVRRDRAARASRPVEAPSRSRAEAEAEGAVARTGVALEPAPDRTARSRSGS
jgi:cytochrome b6-f complex iron-sulfur subunit